MLESGVLKGKVRMKGAVKRGKIPARRTKY